MSLKHSDEFKRDAVRIALTSGLTRRQVASDLSIGLSTLGKWIASISDETQEKIPTQDTDLLRENERLRKENRILREEREILKKAAIFFRSTKAVRFQFITDYRGSLSRSRICRLMGVTDRGLRICMETPSSITAPAS